MIKFCTPIAVGIALGLASDGPLPARQSASFHGGTSTVSVYVTVTDRDGHLLPNLRADEFTVLDNGTRQPLTVFSSGTRPVAIVLLFDRSGSVAARLGSIRAGAVDLFTRLLPTDVARIAVVTEQPAFKGPFTRDLDELIRAMWADVEPVEGTALWQGLDMALSALAPLSARRSVVVLSDGWDTQRSSGQRASYFEALTSRTQAEDTVVYSIGSKALATPRGGGAGSVVLEPKPELRRLAVESGGWYVEPSRDEEFKSLFARIADELHSEYELGFRLPVSDGAVHRIEVQIRKPAAIVKARSHYTAPKHRE